MSPGSHNIASLIELLAEDISDQPALIVPRAKSRKQVTFRELHTESLRLARGLAHYGIQPQQRVLLMVPPGIEFITLTFALFRLGAVPVLIDPGLGRRHVLQCIRDASPAAMVAVPLAHAARKLFPAAFHSVKKCVTVGKRWFWGGATLEKIHRTGTVEYPLQPVTEEAPAAILFTSGSTGPPKGVVYTHAMFFHQVKLLQAAYGIRRGEVDLPTFPLFALFGVALGMTCVIPDMDPTRPARVDPRNIIGAVQEFSVTNSFGSPALWDTVSRYCLQQEVRLPTLRRVLMAGAPVPGSLLERFENILEPGALVHTPYGATEALPVTTIDHHEILRETWQQTQQGHGACVGRPVPGLELNIIRISDDPISQWDEALVLPRGQIGEVVVQAPWVTREYFQRETDSRMAKIPHGDRFWHRMGDVGYLDEQGRLWFCGRKNHRVVTGTGTLFTIPCEAIFNTHPEVKRAALVGVGPRGQQRPAILIEREPGGTTNDEALRRELLELAGRNETTRAIQDLLFHSAFPVDVRHNAKIGREILARWAAKQLNT